MEPAVWTAIVAAITLLVLISGGLAAIIQSQLNGIAKLAEVRAECLDQTIRNVDKDISAIRQELIGRRKEFFHRDEFELFRNSLNDKWLSQAEINKQATESHLSIKAWNAWKAERDIRSVAMERAINNSYYHNGNGVKNDNGSSS